jgi:hypothetical protein
MGPGNSLKKKGRKGTISSSFVGRGGDRRGHPTDILRQVTVDIHLSCPGGKDGCQRFFHEFLSGLRI